MGQKDTHVVDDEVQIARGDHLTIQETLLILNARHRARRLLHNHQLLNHLFLVSVEEAGKFAGIQGRVKLEERAQCRYWRLCAHFRQEKPEVALSRLDGRFFHVCSEELGVVIWWGVGGDELGAGVEEKLFESGNSFLSVMIMKTRRIWSVKSTDPRDILVNCSP